MERPRSDAGLERLPSSIDELQQALAAQDYIADRSIAVSVFLALKLGRPLFLEGEAGVGKTEVAKALAGALGAQLIRLQCYEGLDIGHAVYEWDYPRQLLEIRLLEAAHALGDRGPDGEGSADAVAPARAHLFSEAFLIKRPLLRALESAGDRPTVLLIDEIDRADEEFEGYLLELLSDFQVTIPELGTIRAARAPIVILTSNRTREVHDALKRRCLYLWIDYPDFEKELRIIEARVPGASRTLAEQVAAFVQELRGTELYKVPGVSETLDWTAALLALDRERLDPPAIDETIGILLKYHEDIQAVRGPRAGEVLSRALARGARRSDARIAADRHGSGG
jgi:MoxR-like ATPase